MGGKDPYEVLGVNRDASEDEIKEAYREKVKRYHPDACEKENAEELFKRVKDAYETLQSERCTDTCSGQRGFTACQTSLWTDSVSLPRYTEAFFFFGVGRVFGAIAAVVSPLMLLVMRLILPPMVIGTSPLGGITVAESFVWISIPALVIAGFLQVLYEGSYLGFLTGY